MGTAAKTADLKNSLTEAANTALTDYSATVTGAADAAKTGLQQAARTAEAGTAQLDAAARRDYRTRKAAAAALTAQNGSRGLLGSEQYGQAEQALAGELGKNASAAAATQAALAGTLSSLQAGADARQTSARAGTGQVLSELLQQEGVRSDEALRAAYEQQLQEESTRADEGSSQQETEESYLRALGLTLMQGGVMPTERMLEALGISSTLAQAYIRYFRYYG